jgi:hypothetical protein
MRTQLHFSGKRQFISAASDNFRDICRAVVLSPPWSFDAQESCTAPYKDTDSESQRHNLMGGGAATNSALF